MAPTSSKANGKSSTNKANKSAPSRSKTSKSQSSSRTSGQSSSKKASKSSSSVKGSKPQPSSSSSRKTDKRSSTSTSKSRKTERSSRKKSTKALSDGDYPPGTYFDDGGPAKHSYKYDAPNYVPRPPPNFPSASSPPPMYGKPPKSMAGTAGRQGLKSVFKGSKKVMRFAAETGLELLDM